jgi:hypothetical protein
MSTPTQESFNLRARTPTQESTLKDIKDKKRTRLIAYWKLPCVPDTRLSEDEYNQKSEKAYDKLRKMLNEDERYTLDGILKESGGVVTQIKQPENKFVYGFCVELAVTWGIKYSTFKKNVFGKEKGVKDETLIKYWRIEHKIQKEKNKEMEADMEAEEGPEEGEQSA